MKLAVESETINACSILGGTGAIGGATAMLLAQSGWAVDVTGRDLSRMPKEPSQVEVRFHELERNDTHGVEGLIENGVDLLVGLAAYSAPQVAALLPAMSRVNSLVLISSRAVHVDDAGRHINGDTAPHFAALVNELNPTVLPASDDVNPFIREGYAPCKLAAELAALDSGLPVTVIRPSKVHGRWAWQAPTKSFVDLMTSGSRIIKLSDADTMDHLTAAANAAALIRTVAGHPGSRILNAVDPDTATAAEIVGAIATELSWKGRIEHLAHGSEEGHHPWQTALTLDSTAALELGYRAVGNGLDLIAEEVQWILSQKPGQ